MCPLLLHASAHDAVISVEAEDIVVVSLSAGNPGALATRFWQSQVFILGSLLVCGIAHFATVIVKHHDKHISSSQCGVTRKFYGGTSPKRGSAVVLLLFQIIAGTSHDDALS
jgi:hypothetical protein